MTFGNLLYLFNLTNRGCQYYADNDVPVIVHELLDKGLVQRASTKVWLTEAGVKVVSEIVQKFQEDYK